MRAFATLAEAEEALTTVAPDLIAGKITTAEGAQAADICVSYGISLAVGGNPKLATVAVSGPAVKLHPKVGAFNWQQVLSILMTLLQAYLANPTP